MGEWPVFRLPAVDGGGDHGGAVLIARVVLEDQHRPHAILFRADGWSQIGKIYIPAQDMSVFVCHIVILCKQGPLQSRERPLPVSEICSCMPVFDTTSPGLGGQLNRGGRRAPGISPLRGSLRAAPIV